VVVIVLEVDLEDLEEFVDVELEAQDLLVVVVV
jgi:hypothetical protein